MPRLYIEGIDLSDPDTIYCQCGWWYPLRSHHRWHGRGSLTPEFIREKIADIHLLSEHQDAIDYSLEDCEHGFIRRSCQECEA